MEDKPNWRIEITLTRDEEGEPTGSYHVTAYEYVLTGAGPARFIAAEYTCTSFKRLTDTLRDLTTEYLPEVTE